MLTPAFQPSPFPIPPHLPPDSHSPHPFRPIEGLGYLLRFNGIENKVWTGSLLILQPLNNPINTLTMFENNLEIGCFEGMTIDSHGGMNFVRYTMRLPLNEGERRIEYQVEGREMGEFHVPSANNDARIAFHTCNGFGHDTEHPMEDWGGIQPLWRDLLRRHAESPFHIQIGGGDQLYADGNPHNILQDVPFLTAWFKVHDIHDRFKVEWTYEAEKQFSDFYFLAYIYHFQEPEFATSLSTIPYAFICDDHDILDGYGSYPFYIQDSPVMHHLGRIAYRFYLLFQNHSTFTNTTCFPAPAGYSWLMQAGPSTLLLAVDNRSSRTIRTIVSEECWEAVWERLENAIETSDTTIKHLFFVATVPIVYPRLKLPSLVFKAIAKFQNQVRSVVRTVEKSVGGGFRKMFKRSALLKGKSTKPVGKHVVGFFGQPELKDDLTDEWTHPGHLEERNNMVRHLQDIAYRHRVRVTLLSGDVHIGGFGRFRSPHTPAIADHRLMLQVISSAIGNNPPPDGMITLLHSGSRSIRNCGVEGTREEMMRVFWRDVDGRRLKHHRLLNRRNWAMVEVETGGGVVVTLNVEGVDRERDAVRYGVTVPALV